MGHLETKVTNYIRIIILTLACGGMSVPALADPVIVQLYQECKADGSVWGGKGRVAFVQGGCSTDGMLTNSGSDQVVGYNPSTGEIMRTATTSGEVTAFGRTQGGLWQNRLITRMRASASARITLDPPEPYFNIYASPAVSVSFIGLNATLSEPAKWSVSANIGGQSFANSGEGWYASLGPSGASNHVDVCSGLGYDVLPCQLSGSVSIVGVLQLLVGDCAGPKDSCEPRIRRRITNPSVNWELRQREANKHGSFGIRG